MTQPTFEEWYADSGVSCNRIFDTLSKEQMSLLNMLFYVCWEQSATTKMEEIINKIEDFNNE
jgi:hypothetical protein